MSQATFSPAVARRGVAALEAEIQSAGPFSLCERLMIPSLGNAAKKFAYGQASVDLARTAVALERYRLAQGEFPSSLEALAPQFKVPRDVIGGQALRYRQETNGLFTLYSIGWNETDEGGVPAFKTDGSVDTQSGDWVWRYPSK